MGQIKFFATILMTVVFAIAIISFVTEFGANNDVINILDTDDPLVTHNTNLQSDVIVFSDAVNGSAEALLISSLESGDTTTSSGGGFKTTISGSLTSLKRTLTLGYIKIFGNENENSGKGIVLTALFTFLAFVSVMYMVKTWLGHNPD